MINSASFWDIISDGIQKSNSAYVMVTINVLMTLYLLVTLQQ